MKLVISGTDADYAHAEAVAASSSEWHIAVFNPETSILIQKRHPYTGSLISETPGDSKNAFLQQGDVLGSLELSWQP